MNNYHFTITYDKPGKPEHLVAFVAASVKDAINIIFNKYKNILSVKHDYTIPVVETEIDTTVTTERERNMKGVF